MSRTYPLVEWLNDDDLLIATAPGCYIALSTPDANFIQAELRRLLTEVGVTMRDAV